MLIDCSYTNINKQTEEKENKNKSLFAIQMKSSASGHIVITDATFEVMDVSLNFNLRA